MTNKRMQSSELTAGAGFVYEGHVAAYFLAAMLTGELRPPLNISVKTVALQQSAYGAPLDDIIVTFEDGLDTSLYLQVKRSLTISAAASNRDFREVVKNSWLTYKDQINSRGDIYYGAAVDTISPASLRNFRAVCQAARNSHDVAVFLSRNNEAGTSSIDFDNTIRDIKAILGSEGIGFSDSELHDFLRGFVILNFDVTTPESLSNTQTINSLRQVLTAPSRANDLWERLKNTSREGAGISATYDKGSLKQLLYPLFIFKSEDQLESAASVLTAHDSQISYGSEEPSKCTIAITTIFESESSLRLTAIISTDNEFGLADEVRGWKEKLKRSSLLNECDKELAAKRPLKELLRSAHMASILLQFLATADFFAYIYYCKSPEASAWQSEKVERELVVIPLFHRLSNRREVVEKIYSNIPEIRSLAASSIREVEVKYRRSASPVVTATHARNRSEILELSDLVADVVGNYISDRCIYPKEYIAYIRTRIKYGENIITGEKHKRNLNPIS